MVFNNRKCSAVPGAEAVLDFRTLLLSRRFNDFWTARANTHVTQNDALTLTA